MQIGSVLLENNLFVAPMAGVMDRPFRALCKRLGAGYAVGEMVTSKRELWQSKKTAFRVNHEGEQGPIAVQIAGTQPAEMADAARFNIDHGAQIVDINMGCPAKKVCQKWAGSALMQDEKLAMAIIDAVVGVCALKNVPVTLKIRTGWSETKRNALSIAVAAQAAGVSMLTVHGRTREQGYRGDAEYDTVARIKQAVKIPVVANGDIDSPLKAKWVLDRTGVDALMIGRAAQSRPWIFKNTHQFLLTGIMPEEPRTKEIRQWMIEYLQDHYSFYGEYLGVRNARKHIGWLVQGLPDGHLLRQKINQVESAGAQICLVNDYIEKLEADYLFWPFPAAQSV